MKMEEAKTLLYNFLVQEGILFNSTYCVNLNKIDPQYPEDIILEMPSWSSTIEGTEYWQMIHKQWRTYLRKIIYEKGRNQTNIL